MSSKSKNFCSVPQCKNYSSANVSMHYFPKDHKLAKTWGIRLKIGKPISKYMCVCSEHFTLEDFTPNTRDKTLKRLMKGVIPSQKLPETSSSRQRNVIRSGRKWLDAVDGAEASGSGSVSSVPDCFSSDASGLLSVPEQTQHYGSNTEPLPNKFDEFSEKSAQTPFCLYDLSANLQSDYSMMCFTGVDRKTVKTLETCCENILRLNSEEIPENLQVRIVLVLTKLKCNHSFRCLAILFNLSNTTCIRHFYWTLSLLATVLKPLIKWPSKEEIVANMPKCFKNFSNTRVVLDCTEMPVQKSKCLVSRIKSYSHYKGTLTVKFLIGITPSGMISYISPCYGGRASDKGIFNKENFMSKLDPLDGVMVDKGFMIEDECEDYFIKLIRPPFLKKKKQFSKEEADQTAEIARARIHVERAIQRIKMFGIISSQIKWYLIPHLDQIMTIIGGLVNMSPPILSTERF